MWSHCQEVGYIPIRIPHTDDRQIVIRERVSKDFRGPRVLQRRATTNPFAEFGWVESALFWFSCSNGEKRLNRNLGPRHQLTK